RFLPVANGAIGHRSAARLICSRCRRTSTVGWKFSSAESPTKRCGTSGKSLQTAFGADGRHSEARLTCFPLLQTLMDELKCLREGQTKRFGTFGRLRQTMVGVRRILSAVKLIFLLYSPIRMAGSKFLHAARIKLCGTSGKPPPTTAGVLGIHLE